MDHAKWKDRSGRIADQMKYCPIDPRAIENLRDVLDGDPELLTELIDLFLGDAPMLMASLSAAVERQDIESLTQTAHSLKGSASNLGARGMAALCANLERRGRSGSLVGAETACRTLRKEFEVVRDALVVERLRWGELLNEADARLH
jgi:HPt (histidine-containing phosphotransfer) domain-containing protein